MHSEFNLSRRRLLKQTVVAGIGVCVSPLWASVAIDQQIKQHGANGDWLVVDHQNTTQSVDPMFLEPEVANGWFQEGAGRFKLVSSTRSPQEVVQDGAEMQANCRFPVSNLAIHAGYIGGGFGGKDHSIFPYYGMLAGLYGDGKPVRLALNRFEQFQMGIKRHAFTMDARLAIDKATAQFQALTYKIVSNGGGRANFSASVAAVGASDAPSIYYFPNSDLAATAVHSRAVVAGSMRVITEPLTLASS